MNPRLPAAALAAAAGGAALAAALDVPADQARALALMWAIAVLWLTEALHVTVTAFLVPVLAVALGLMPVAAAVANFAHPIIFLFLGGFALAGALHAQGLDRALADAVLAATGGRLSRAVRFLALSAAFLSMWISNTAVTLLMLPLALGLLAEQPDLPARTRTYALLAVAFSANVGGMGTLIGTAPNALVAAELGLDFTAWLAVGLPVVALLWPLAMAGLRLALRPEFGDDRVALSARTFAWTPKRRLLVAIFAATAAAWVAGPALGGLLGIERHFDSWVGLCALIALCATGVVSWREVEARSDWGVLFMFGGGLTLSAALEQTGASGLLGEGLAALVADWHPLWMLAALVAFVVLLTEITSNTATTALLLPVFLALPDGPVPPATAALAVGLAASCAFMLPVATPPNALVYGTGQVPQRLMVRAGLLLNLFSVLALTALLGLRL